MPRLLNKRGGLGGIDTSPGTNRATAELRRMRRSLKGWLDYRLKMDAVAAGKVKGKLSPQATAELLSAYRDPAIEARMAHELYALLSEVFDSQALPHPGSPGAAVALAKIAVSGALPGEAPAPQAQGIVWLWPVVIVGGAAFVLLGSVRSFAEVAKERERYACIKAGACTDYGFYLKWGAILAGGYFIWTHLGVGKKLKEKIAKV